MTASKLPTVPADRCDGEDPQLVNELYQVTGGAHGFAVAAARTMREHAEATDPDALSAADAAALEEQLVKQLIQVGRGEGAGTRGTYVQGDRAMLRALQAIAPDADATRSYEDRLLRERAAADLENNGPAIRAHMARLRAEARVNDRSAGRSGTAFILGRPPTVRTMWGAGPAVLWAAGQSLMLVADTGIGKTTLAGLLIRAQLRGGDVMGLPVRPVTGNILLMAMDRSEQIGASLARQFSDDDRDLLDRLIVLPGPPPGDMAENPELLAKLAKLHNADVVYLDSLKDAAIGLSDDRVGAAYNQARQQALREGRQLCELHHTTKNGSASYGSAWLMAGAGSVVQLEGKRGSDVGRLVHVKQPAAEVGPWSLRFDRMAGEIWRDRDGGDDGAELAADVDLVAMAADGGVTARQAAEALNRTAKPTPAQVTQAHRELDRRVETGQLRRSEHAGPRGAVAWVPA